MLSYIGFAEFSTPILDINAPMREVTLIKVNEPIMPVKKPASLIMFNNKNYVREVYRVSSCAGVFLNSQPYRVTETMLVDDSEYLRDNGITVEARALFKKIPHVSVDGVLKSEKLPITNNKSGIALNVFFPESSYKRWWYSDADYKHRLVTVKGFVEVSTSRVTEVFRGDGAKSFKGKTKTKNYVYKPLNKFDAYSRASLYYTYKELPLITCEEMKKRDRGSVLLLHSTSSKWFKASEDRNYGSFGAFGGRERREVNLANLDEYNRIDMSSFKQLIAESQIVGFEHVMDETVRIPLEFQIVVPELIK